MTLTWGPYENLPFMPSLEEFQLSRARPALALVRAHYTYGLLQASWSSTTDQSSRSSTLKPRSSLYLDRACTALGPNQLEPNLTHSRDRRLGRDHPHQLSHELTLHLSSSSPASITRVNHPSWVQPKIDQALQSSDFIDQHQLRSLSSVALYWSNTRTQSSFEITSFPVSLGPLLLQLLMAYSILSDKLRLHRLFLSSSGNRDPNLDHAGNTQSRSYSIRHMASSSTEIIGRSQQPGTGELVNQSNSI